jgi:hypothetical protein
MTGGSHRKGTFLGSSRPVLAERRRLRETDEMSELRVELAGGEAKLGEVPAADVARLILGVERAMARAASVVVGRPKTTTGRYDDVIERAVRLKLHAVMEGSVVPVLEVPEFVPTGDSTLDVEATSLGDAALAQVLDAADPQKHPHPVVAKGLLELAEGLRVGERYDAITFDSKDDGRRRRVRVDGEVRARLRAYVDSGPLPPVRQDAVIGVLVEADFEKRTARLRTPTQPAVQVTFTDDLDDDIQAALRQQATLRGEIVFDPITRMARSVVLRLLDRGEQLVLGLDAEEFWRERSFEGLAREQGAGEPVDAGSLYDAEASDEERDAFMAVLAEL